MYTSRCGCIHPLRISAMDVSTLMMSYLKKHLQQHKTLQATVGLLEWHCVVTQANLMSNLTKLNEFSWFIGISYTKYILLFHTNTRGIEPYHCCIVSSGGRMHSMCFVLTVLIAGKLLSIWMFETINIQIWMYTSRFENIQIWMFNIHYENVWERIEHSPIWRLTERCVSIVFSVHVRLFTQV